MSESALPPCDRSEEPDPPARGERRSTWIKRLARDLYGHDLDQDEAKARQRRRQSQDERTDMILRGIDPDAPGVEG